MPDTTAPGPTSPAPGARTRYRVPSPDTLTFGAQMGIHAATGVDVLNPPTRAHAIAACLWYVARADGLTFEACLDYNLDDVDLGADEIDQAGTTGEEDDPEDPTSGPEIPSSGS